MYIGIKNQQVHLGLRSNYDLPRSIGEGAEKCAHRVRCPFLPRQVGGARMIICSQPECQTTAGCTCTNRLFDYSRLRGEVTAKSAEISALKKQVEELTAERDKYLSKLNSLGAT